ncbi:hypothetical protein [Streptomyces indicus]|nr:hypothetical protein [Streptomyces indicus]
MHDGPSHEEALRRRLRDAAAAHQPDRARMLARVERGMAAATDPSARSAARRERRGAAPWLRVVGATAAVASAVALGGYGVASAVRDAEPGPRTVATSPDARPDRTTPAPSPSGHPSASSTRRPGEQPATGGTSPTERDSAPPAGGTRSSESAGSAGDGPRTVPAAELLWADGAVDADDNAFWSQSTVTVKAREPLTALTVEMRLSAAGHPADTGNWRSLPAEDFDVTVRPQDDGGLLYRWTLKPGRTVPAGEHVFAAQYGHDAGERNARGDACSVRAGTQDRQAEWAGDFA